MRDGGLLIFKLSFAENCPCRHLGQNGHWPFVLNRAAMRRLPVV
jgi:hypothetical protein